MTTEKDKQQLDDIIERLHAVLIDLINVSDKFPDKETIDTIGLLSDAEYNLRTVRMAHHWD